MNKEDIILTALRLLLVDPKGEFEVSRDATRQLIDDALEPKEKKKSRAEQQKEFTDEMNLKEKDAEESRGEGK